MHAPTRDDAAVSDPPYHIRYRWVTAAECASCECYWRSVVQVRGKWSISSPTSVGNDQFTRLLGEQADIDLILHVLALVIYSDGFRCNSIGIGPSCYASLAFD